MKILYRLRFLLFLNMGILLFSCSDEDLPSSHESPYGTKIESIEITNAGADGNKIVKGVIHYDKSEITFPILSQKTDFSNIHFNAVLSEGARLDKETYNFTMEDDNAEKSQIITVSNHTRSFEYRVTLVRNMPPKGADFSEIKTYDFSTHTNNIYPSFTSGDTRGSASDGENILVIDRTKGKGNVQLLNVSELIKWEPGKSFSPQVLDASNPPVDGGTLPYSTGAVVNGHVYLMNISSAGGGLKLYYYETPTSEAQVILHDKTVCNGRYADATTFNLDEKGNGTIFCFQNTAGTQNNLVIKINISNFTTVTSVSKFTGRNSGAYGSYGKVDKEQLYIYAGKDLNLAVADASGNILFEDKTGVFMPDAMDPRVFYFNKARYLMYVTTGIKDSANTIYIYDITTGDGIVDALNQFIKQVNKSPAFSYKIGGINSWNGNTNYKVYKDETGKDSELFIYGARTGGGFAFFKAPIKPYVELEDE